VITVKVVVQLFAVARERAGGPSVEIELPPGATVADLRHALAEQVPALSGMIAHLKFAVDQEYAADDVEISPRSQVACIPPVSGG
jgi:molybdopterin converting factor subunit 1